MEKKLIKELQTQLEVSMHDVLSRINPEASLACNKKVKEAGKMVTKKFVKTIEVNEKKIRKSIELESTGKKKK
jgi:hypothetical protein